MPVGVPVVRMDEPAAAVDVSTVQFDATFPDLETFPGEMGAIATLLSPDGVRLELRLPGGDPVEERASGRDLLFTYAYLAEGRRVPWFLGDEFVEVDGSRVLAPGDPPLSGDAADFRRTLGALAADLFRALENAGLDPVHTTQQYLGPRPGLDAEEVYEWVTGTERPE